MSKIEYFQALWAIMRYANNIKGEKIEVSFTGEKAICCDCGSEVHGRKGQIRAAYWKHPNNSDCDRWYEPITKWHIDWQNEFPKDYQEISLLDNETGEIHRADIQLPSGFVIEVQNSPIKISEIKQREKFYGKNGLIWILNGYNLAKQSRVSFNFEKQIFAVSSEIPSYIEEFSDYNMDSINELFWDSSLINEIRNHDKIKNIDNQNGNQYWFEYKARINYEELVDNIEDELYQIIINLYGYRKYREIIEHFETKIHLVSENRYLNVELDKLYWRKFIDLMEYPVFIDNIEGLPDNCVLWYQKRQIIEKYDLIKEIGRAHV